MGPAEVDDELGGLAELGDGLAGLFGIGGDEDDVGGVDLGMVALDEAGEKKCARDKGDERGTFGQSLPLTRKTATVPRRAAPVTSSIQIVTLAPTVCADIGASL